MSEPAPPRPRPAREVAGPLAALLAGSVAGAAAWWLLAPTPPVQRRGDLLLAPGVPELYVAQDGWFSVVAVALGALTGVGLLLRPGRRRPERAAVTVLGAGVAAVLMWQLGGRLAGALGGDGAAPLTVHAPGVLALWPATAATVLFVGYLWSDLALGGRAD